MVPPEQVENTSKQYMYVCVCICVIEHLGQDTTTCLNAIFRLYASKIQFKMDFDLNMQFYNYIRCMSDIEHFNP